MGQPHAAANANSGVSAQGYLVASGDQLRYRQAAVPAVFHRRDGKFHYFHLQSNGHKGGTTTPATGTQFINGGLLFNAPPVPLLETVGPGVFAAFPEGVVRSTAAEMVVSRWSAKEKKDRRGNAIKYRGLEKLWSVKDAPGGGAVLVAGQSIVVGGAKRVSRVDMVTQKVTWSAEVEGTAYGLAAANGRLYVSTERGWIHCFAVPGTAKPVVIQPVLQASPYGQNAVAAAMAREIVEKAGVRDGYCVDLGCGDGALAYELAQRTRLHIYAIDADAEKVALARSLDAAGLLGVRVTVHHGDPTRCPYPKYVADLVISGRSMTGAAIPLTEAQRLQRPFGGVICIGKPGAWR